MKGDAAIMNNNGFSNIIYTLMISFFGALAKEINDKSKTNESFNIFFGEIILHGFSGWIFALITSKYLGWTDMNSLTIAAGIGGLFGFDLMKLVLKIGVKLFASAKSIKLDDSDTDFSDKQK
jgi:hypothetical protein